jgi:gluconate 2-dehydrogenase gamma chain
MDRRRFILAGGPALALTTLAATGCQRGAPQKEAPYSPSFFRPGEWALINAAVARLIPTEGAGPGALEAGVPEFIDRQMELPYGHGAYFYLKGPFLTNTAPTLGYQLRYTPRELYRLGIEDANTAARRLHGRDFPSLAAPDQDQFLEAMEKGELSFPTIPSAVFFAQLLANTKEGYFADPLYGGNRNMVTWRWIGFPGARADFTDWIDRPGRPYPYGPVSIAGQS